MASHDYKEFKYLHKMIRFHHIILSFIKKTNKNLH